MTGTVVGQRRHRSSRDGAMRSRLLGFLITCGFLFGVIVAVHIRAHSSTDAETARCVVERSYRYAMTGDFDELRLCRRKWQDLEARFGRVREFRIIRECWAWTPYEFEVEVARDRARTRELATALAGPSKVYGYYVSPSASDVRVLEALSRK